MSKYLIIFLFPLFVFSQTRDFQFASLSENGQFCLLASREGDSLHLAIANTFNGKILKHYSLAYSQPIESIQTNNTGQLVLINNQTVVAPRFNIVRTYPDELVILPNTSNIPFVISNDERYIAKVNLVSNTNISLVKLPSGLNIKSYYFANSDKWLIISGENKTRLIETETMAGFTKKNIEDFAFSDNFRFMLTYNDQGLQLWDFKTSSRVANIQAAYTFAKYIRKNKLSYHQQSLGNTNQIALSNNGRYACQIVEGKDGHFAIIFDYASKEIVCFVHLNQYFQDWSDLVVPSFDKEELLLNCESGEQIRIPYLEETPQPVRNSLFLPEEIKPLQAQVEETRISFPKAEISILVKGKNTYVQQNNFNLPPIEIKGGKLVEVSRNNKIMLVQSPDGGFGVVNIQSQNPSDVSRILWLYTPPPSKEEVLEEGELLKEVGFAGTVDTENSSIPLTIKVRKTNITENTATVDFQIKDSTGRVVTGYADVQNKSKWCKFLIRQPDGIILPPEDILISEYQEGEQPIHISVVMDYSGSMGLTRVEQMEQAVIQIAEIKSEKDRMSIIKFDDDIQTTGDVSLLSRKITKEVNKNGYDKFGGGTCLYDALLTSEDILITQGSAEKRVIFLITDGQDMGSMNNLTKVIYFAQQNNIAIFPLGFGNKVNDDVLQAMADHTGGEYYKIFNSRDFFLRLEEIYQNQKYFYRTSFKLTQNGEYSFVLKLCDENLDDNYLEVSFNHSGAVKPPIDFNDTTLYQPITLTRPRIGEFIDNQYPDTILSDYLFNNGDTAKMDFEKIKLPVFVFKKNKTIIVNDPTIQLDSLVLFLRNHPDINLTIEGHTDADGDFESNIKLSKERAEAIKQLIIARGINSERLIARGYGSSQPLVPEDSAEQKQINRRVEFKITRE